MLPPVISGCLGQRSAASSSPASPAPYATAMVSAQPAPLRRHRPLRPLPVTTVGGNEGGLAGQGQSCWTHPVWAGRTEGLPTVRLGLSLSGVLGRAALSSAV